MDTDRVTGVGVARTYYLWKIGHHQDLTWYGYDLYVSSVAEVQLAIICICLPFVRSFCRAYFPGLITTTRTQTASPGNRPTAEWSAIGEECGDDATLSYELDEKGLVVPKCRSVPATKDMLSREEQEEIEWARQQVQRSDYIPQQGARKTLSISSTEVSEKAGISGTERLTDQDQKSSIDEAERDEDWKRSKVRDWVTKRPVKTASVV